MSGFMGIGNAFNPLQAVSQVALAAATGGTSIIAQMAVRVAVEAASQLIQNLGDALNLPQPMIDMAQGSLRGSMGDFAGAANEYSQASQGAGQLFESYAQQVGASAFDAASGGRDVNQSVAELGARAAEGEDFRAARSGGREGGSWLMALATALGEKLDAMADDIKGLADAITKEDPSTTAKFGAATQEFGILMNATNNALKTLGEAITTTARKG
jgi:hypothetical protein